MYLFDEGNLAQTQSLPIADLWHFLPLGYVFTIMIETPILLVGLSPEIAFRQKLFCGIWLTACTYPIVILVLPMLFFGEPRWQYLAVAETFAPVGECFIFWLAFRRRAAIDRPGWVRCLIAIVLANLASFGLGEVLDYYRWFE